MLRRYARIVGAGMLLLGGACMLGVGSTNPAVDLDHLFVGGLLAYAGFRRWDEEFARSMLRGLGVIYLLAGLLAFVTPALLFGVYPETHNGILLNHLVHLTVGVSNVAAAFLRQDVLAKVGKALRGRQEERHPVEFHPSGPASRSSGIE